MCVYRYLRFPAFEKLVHYSTALYVIPCQQAPIHRKQKKNLANLSIEILVYNVRARGTNEAK